MSLSNALLTGLLGRVGEAGQFDLSLCTSLDDAIRRFFAKFKSKAKLPFEKRDEPPKPGITLIPCAVRLLIV